MAKTDTRRAAARRPVAMATADFLGTRGGRALQVGAAPSLGLPAAVVEMPAPGRGAGQKDDGTKARWSLIPAGVLAPVVDVLEHGARKYAAENWKFVPNARQRYFDALMRHVHAWWQGEAADPETGKSHLAHAACCIFFLMWLERNPS